MSKNRIMITPHESVFFLIHSASLKITRLMYNRIVKDSGPTMQEWRVLQIVVYDYPCTATHVSESTGIHQSHISVVVSKLIRKGMIKRSRSIDDARQKDLTPTPKGSKLVKKLYPKAGQVAKSVWTQLRDSDYEYAYNMMRNMVNTLDKML